LKVQATFVTSAASVDDLPRDGLAEIAMVGRSNVGKSSLINALVRQGVARTSAAPGKTRLANIYRVAHGGGPPFYLVDLPGYGYARRSSAQESRADASKLFEELTSAYFAERRPGQAWGWGPTQVRNVAALLLVDARHPGLQSDIEAWAWLKTIAAECAVVATKVDKLASGQRIRALRELESVLEDSVLPVSAVTGEGLDELWKLIDRLANSPNNPQQPPRNPPKATAPRQPTRAAAPRASPPGRQRPREQQHPQARARRTRPQARPARRKK
jgi:GTP-binding protein